MENLESKPVSKLWKDKETGEIVEFTEEMKEELETEGAVFQSSGSEGEQEDALDSNIWRD